MEGEVMARHYTMFETAGGTCGIAWSGAGITRFQLPARDAAATERALHRRLPDPVPGTPTPPVVAAIGAVRRYFDGTETDLADVAVDLDGQDDLACRIYRVLRGVGWGCTTTYGALARAIGGGPEVARDVGQAMARNPVPLIVPCHRVLAAGGKLGGFSAPGGAHAKRDMLRLEGVDLAPPAPRQPALNLT